MSVHFLLVEKDESFRSVVNDLLIGSGFEVTIADTPGDAMAVAEQGDIDLMISDFIVSFNDELRLIKNISTLKIPVIMLTGFTQADFVKKAIQAGAVDFICKSEFDSTNFLLRVNKNVKKHVTPKQKAVTHTQQKIENPKIEKTKQPKKDETVDPIRKEIEEKLDQVTDVKIMSTSVSGMMELLNNKVLSLNDIFQQVSQDAAFSAKIVKVANSPLFRLKTPAKTLEQAIINIGRDGIESLVMGVGLIDNVMANAQGLDRIEICKHSLICAVIAKEIANHVKFVDSDLAFLSGLLHDVGKFFLEDTMKEKYVELTKKAKEINGDLHELELREFKIDHAEFGAQVFKRWGFQEELIETIGYHHLSYAKILELKNVDRILIGVVAIANSIANMYPMSNMGTEMMEMIDNTFLNFIGIRESDDIKKITSNIRKKVSDLKHILIPPKFSQEEDEEDFMPREVSIYVLGAEKIVVEPIAIRYQELCSVNYGLNKSGLHGVLIYFINREEEVTNITAKLDEIRNQMKFKGRIVILIPAQVKEALFINAQDNIHSFKLPMSVHQLDEIIKSA